MEFSSDIYFNSNPTKNSVLSISYNGHLTGSQDVWIVYGFGSEWENTTELKMEKSSDGSFLADITMLDYDTFNFCFRNNNYEWDNNNSFNYISSIESSYEENLNELFAELFEPVEDNCVDSVKKFDIDGLIDDILQPIFDYEFEEVAEKLENSNIEIIENSVDLDSELSKLLSELSISTNESISDTATASDLLSADIINESNIDLFDDTNEEYIDFTNENILEFTFDNFIEETYDETDKENISLAETNENTEASNEETGLSILGETNFSISPRKLSRFYLFRKRIKLSFAKIFYKLPKILFDSETEHNRH